MPAILPRFANENQSVLPCPGEQRSAPSPTAPPTSRDELAAFNSINSSARRSEGCTVRFESVAAARKQQPTISALQIVLSFEPRSDLLDHFATFGVVF